MSLKDEFRKMVTQLSEEFPISKISQVYFPPFFKGGQPKDAEFMALFLEDGAVGISYVLLPDDKMEEYMALKPSDFIGKATEDFALEFGTEDPIKNMMGLAALNAVCQHVMKQTSFPLDFVTDSLGLLAISKGDKVGMVGFFPPLIKMVEKASAELIIIEKKVKLIEQFPKLPITLDPKKLKKCNKVLCTSTTILNNTLNEILLNCSLDAKVSIIGPTAGYFPDPLFAQGIDVVGGTRVYDSDLFFQLISEKRRWGPATQKFCFQKSNYPGLPKR